MRRVSLLAASWLLVTAVLSVGRLPYMGSCFGMGQDGTGRGQHGPTAMEYLR